MYGCVNRLLCACCLLVFLWLLLFYKFYYDMIIEELLEMHVCCLVNRIIN